MNSPYLRSGCLSVSVAVSGGLGIVSGADMAAVEVPPCGWEPSSGGYHTERISISSV